MVFKVAVPGKLQFKLYRREPGFLLTRQGDVHYIGGSEVFPPPLETEKENALREVFEECGLNVILNDKFRAEYTFRTLDNTEKTCAFYLGYFEKEAAVTIQQEEVIGDWLLGYEEAMAKLNWEQDKEILKKAEEFLNT